MQQAANRRGKTRCRRQGVAGVNWWPLGSGKVGGASTKLMAQRERDCRHLAVCNSRQLGCLWAGCKVQTTWQITGAGVLKSRDE